MPDTSAWPQDPRLGHKPRLHPLPEPGFESVTLTCVNNGAKPGGRIVDVPKLQALVKDQGFLIDGGYGKIKGTTFRLSNMGDETDESMGCSWRRSIAP
jgi:aspartate aminotransferase-like enzyme